jgi:hypothetical protein
MGAVLDSIRAAGIGTQENSMWSDAAVIWSVLWNGRMAANRQVYQHYRSQNKPVIVIDVGALNRGVTWKIAVNNITAQGYYGHLENLDWDRPSKLGISLGQAKGTGSHIVVAAQHSRSQQLDGVDQEAWITDIIQRLKAHTDRSIVVRPHPRSVLNFDRLPAGIPIEKPIKLSNTYDSFDLMFDCHAVVNYNSGPGIQAAVHGCRPIVSSTSLAHPVSVDIQDIERSYDIDRQQWLVQICHSEYTVEELKQGLWLKRISSALQA